MITIHDTDTDKTETTYNVTLQVINPGHGVAPLDPQIINRRI